MIVPASSPNQPGRTAWAIICNGCGTCQPTDTTGEWPTGTIREWLISDDEMDVHYCPPCVRVLAAALIGAVFGEQP